MMPPEGLNMSNTTLSHVFHFDMVYFQRVFFFLAEGGLLLF